MAVLKCKMCGAQLTVESPADTVTCRYCESVQTIPKLDNEELLRMYERATELRLRCEFDQAASVFQNIVTGFPHEAEAYWGLCLCRYGIEYVDDPRTFLKVPTCHRTSAVSILTDADFLRVTENAGPLSWKYLEEAREIDAIRCKILDICKNEQPYDIFICYKETDEKTGLRTDDSLTAQDIYTELIKKDYRVFFSRITLRGKAGSEYEPYIYSALSTAKVMLVLGSNADYFNAVWVRNEWKRFIDMMANDTTKTIIPCFEKIKADELPPVLRSFQGLDMGNKLFFTDLISNIERLCPKAVPQPDSGIKYEEASVGTISKKEFDYPDGAYSGYAVGTKPHGYGIRYYTNGNRYEGNWHMGVMQGEGTFFYADGEAFKGTWSNNIPKNGSGTYRGSDYELRGSLVNSKLDGEGRYFKNGRLKEEGCFKEGRLHGNGVSYLPDGKKCTGEFRNGKPYNAEGVFGITAIRRNAEYTGTWKDGEPTGNGKIIVGNNDFVIQGTFYTGYSGNVTVDFADGRYYEGEFINADLTGVGSFYTSDKALRYKGRFEKASYSGNGILYNEDGTYYDGIFENDSLQSGTHYDNDGSVIFEGKYKNGLPHEGSGKVFYNNNRYMVGDLKNGVPHGNCKSYETDTGRLVFEGTYENGVATKGTTYFSNGDYYSGEYDSDNYFHGQGTYTYNNSKFRGTWEGEWRKGHRWTGNGLFVLEDENNNYTGRIYKGAMRESQSWGEGFLVMEDRSRYVGEFRGGIYNGTYYSPTNAVLDTFSNGVSNNRRKRAIGKAVLEGLSGIRF